MKKLLVALTLSTFLLSACSTQPAAATTSENTTEAEQSSEATTEETTEAEETEESSDAAETSEEVEVSRGTWHGNVYTNTFAGITFNKPESWPVASEEELVELYYTGLEASGMDYSEYLKRIVEMKFFTDMMVRNPTTNSNMFIQFENLSMSIGGTNMTSDQYLDINREQLMAVPSMGYEIDTAYYDMELSGNTYRVFDAVLADRNMTQYFCARKEGKFMINVTITVVGDDTIEEFLSCFS